MTEKLSSSGIEILKKDLYDVPEVSIQRPKFIKIVISTVLLSITIFVLYYIHHSALYPMLNGDAVDNSYLLGVKALFCICLFGGVLLALDIILLIVRRQIAEVNHRLCIFSLIISRNTLYMRVIISLLLSSVLLIYYESLYAPTIELIEDEDISKSIYIVQNFAYIVLALALFFTVQLCRSLMIMVIKYKLHFDIYKERIEKNNQQNEVLYMINKMAGREMYDDVKEWATWVYNLLKYNQPELTRTCCRHFFNEKETEIIFNMFDSDANGVISLKEFIAVFFGVIREKYFLNESLLQKNTLLNKLSWVFSCISVPIGLFLASSVLGGAILVKNQVSTITGAILSLSFVFSAIAGEVFRSLIFIFLVRPFEAGDVLKIDDKILIVKELGLMYTSFTIQSLTNYVQNTKLMDKYIVNYRLSDVEEKIYTYTFHLRPFKTQLEKLESLIGTHLTSDTKKYTGTFYIRNYRHGKGSDITVDIVICFKINFQYVKGLIKNEDEFVFELEDMFKSLNLEVL